jgi:hypothetical protein
MSAFDNLAASAIRGWVTAYTAGLPRSVRDDRRAEMESDVWEHRFNMGSNAAGASVRHWDVLGRCLRGVPADVLWRLSLKGEPKMVSTDFTVRVCGVALLLIVAAAIGMLVAGFGIGTDEYFRDDFPQFARETRERAVGLSLGAALSVATVAAAVGMFAVFRRHQPIAAGAGALALAAAGFLLMVSVVAGFALIQIAQEWTARGSVPNDGAWASAHQVAKMHEGFGFLSVVFLNLGFATFGVLALWKGAVPRWIGAIGACSGLLLVLALFGPLIWEGAFWLAIITATAAGLAWLTATGAWLALKGAFAPRAA